MRRRILGLALLTLTAPLAGQGFGVNEHGSCMMGRAGAGIAAPCADGSGIFFNPAGIVGHRGFLLSVGVTGIKAFGGFTDDFTQTKTDLANGIIPVPHVYAVYGVNDRLAVGAGLFVPYGLGTQWPTTFEGRFNGYDNSLQTIYLQPTVAYQATPQFSIGAGFDVALGSLKLTQAVDLSANPVPGDTTGATFAQLGIPFHTGFANALLKGSGTGIGGHLGIRFAPSDRFAIGARYMTRVKVDYTGTVDFSQVPTNITLAPYNPLSIALAPTNPLINPANPLPLDVVLSTAFSAGQPLADGAVATSITMPDQIVAGIAVRPTADLMVMVDWQMVRWSVFDTLAIDFANTATPDRTLAEGFQDTHAIRVGLEWRTSDKFTLRGGGLWHQGAAPDQTVTPLLPEGDRNEGVIGFGYQLGPTLEVNAAYQYLRQQKRRGRVQDLPINTGLYEFNAHLFGLTLTARF